ncbi:uncharacterized protein LOC129740693 isoform X2 [Uranotaenia lowii]|uniref:uncharacterized protein LOC129740693 isoform X2 n=1 Tax=Uranotaenia lowii TaxID=190385 RepID=UPI0024789589|nr:uncharacterized protein LOC129740693 isoform X2 [Uranotaenia lowii]
MVRSPEITECELECPMKSRRYNASDLNPTVPDERCRDGSFPLACHWPVYLGCFQVPLSKDPVVHVQEYFATKGLMATIVFLRCPKDDPNNDYQRRSWFYDFLVYFVSEQDARLAIEICHQEQWAGTLLNVFCGRTPDFFDESRSAMYHFPETYKSASEASYRAIFQRHGNVEIISKNCSTITIQYATQEDLKRAVSTVNFIPAEKVDSHRTKQRFLEHTVMDEILKKINENSSFLKQRPADNVLKSLCNGEKFNIPEYRIKKPKTFNIKTPRAIRDCIALKCFENAQLFFGVTCKFKVDFKAGSELQSCVKTSDNACYNEKLKANEPMESRFIEYSATRPVYAETYFPLASYWPVYLGCFYVSNRMDYVTTVQEYFASKGLVATVVFRRNSFDDPHGKYQEKSRCYDFLVYFLQEKYARDAVRLCHRDIRCEVYLSVFCGRTPEVFDISRSAKYTFPSLGKRATEISFELFFAKYGQIELVQKDCCTVIIQYATPNDLHKAIRSVDFVVAEKVTLDRPKQRYLEKDVIEEILRQISSNAQILLHYPSQSILEVVREGREIPAASFMALKKKYRSLYVTPPDRRAKQRIAHDCYKNARDVFGIICDFPLEYDWKDIFTEARLLFKQLNLSRGNAALAADKLNYTKRKWKRNGRHPEDMPKIEDLETFILESIQVPVEVKDLPESIEPSRDCVKVVKTLRKKAPKKGHKKRNLDGQGKKCKKKCKENR